MRLALALFTLVSLNACLALPDLQMRPESRRTVASNLSHESEGTLEIYLPYVGQGDGTLFRFPNGKTLLVDAGPQNAGKDRLLPLLRSLKISRLDALLITHYDFDHLGGVPGLLAGEDGVPNTDDDIQVGVAFDRGGEPWDNSPGYPDYLGALDERKIPRHPLTAGEAMDLDSGVSVRCVAVNGSVSMGNGSMASVDLSVPAYSGKENGASVALLVEYSAFRYLTAGDLTGGGSADGFLTPDVETLVGEAVGKVDVVHVNHHGSLSSSNLSYVNATHPEAVIVQAGKDNPYHHPVPEVMDRWKGIGAEVYSTGGETGYLVTSEGKSPSIKPLN